MHLSIIGLMLTVCCKIAIIIIIITLAQIEACLNSRPMTPMPNPEEGIEALTPGHFLIGAPLEALPDPPAS